MLKFITCGSVDDGKSTLIGRLLFDSKTLLEDQLEKLKQESKDSENLEFALLVDGLQSEREQGITIDVAYRFFSTDERKFIIIDTPGHEQYTRNMVTGASNADVAVLLIDARKGVLPQTKRHSYIVSLLGIRDIVLAINKMDLVEFSEKRYLEICEEYRDSVVPQLPNRANFHFVPVSALQGDNIIHKSKNMDWYQGKTLIELLNDLEPLQNSGSEFIFPVQYVNRPHQDFRGFCGTIAGGDIETGDSIVVLPSKIESKVKSIIYDNREVDSASAQMAITLTLTDEVDISRGDVITKPNHSLNISNSFKADIVWLNENGLRLEEEYIIKIYSKTANCKISVDYGIDIHTFQKVEKEKLELNDIARCTLEIDRNLVLDEYDQNRTLGSFILIDKYTNGTVGAGMVRKVLEKREPKRKYTQQDIELNRFIRKFYPEWNCKNIEEDV